MCAVCAVVSRQSQTQECATVTVSLLLRCGPDGGRRLQVRTHCTPRPPSYTQTGWVGGSNYGGLLRGGCRDGLT